VSLAEVRDVLADRLSALELEPPAQRYGRLFVCSPEQARGRSFRVVFVPGLAERLFPQKVREDPLLLDDLRRQVGAALAFQEDRAEHERLLLRLALGAAAERLYVSFPRIETAEARARVPSFYALEVMRAVTGRIPEHQKLELEASETANASLAWPAPARPEDAIDDFEHDLSVLRLLMRSEEDVKGRAHYILTLNECVRRSANARWSRARKQWTTSDGLVGVSEGTKAFLESQRLTARPYSVSALQNYAYCPYRFLLSALYRLQPLEEPEPLERMDPLTKGSLFHEVLAEFFRALRERKLAISSAGMDALLPALDETLTRVAAKYEELLAPAVDRVWRDEIAGIRTDLHIWARELTGNVGWEPWLFEYAFGLPDMPGRDPNSRPEPVLIDGRFILRGAIDLVERRPGTKVLRVIDHKTGRNRSERGSIIGRGQQLQPVIYSLALEAATGCTVETARFSYCTTAGGFTTHDVPINERTRAMGIEALEIIDRSVELGVLVPAPAERACSFCDFLAVCGPNQERRARRKAREQIGDVIELRSRP
jgi:ATP-dependent helicase/DNAse subunit B